MPKLDTQTQQVTQEGLPQALLGQDRRAVGRRKLSIEVSPDLHRRILTICAIRRVPVNEAVREVLDKAFPG